MSNPTVPPKVTGNPLTASELDNIVDSIKTKVDMVTGQGLSDANYTAAEKSKLAGVAIGATVNQTNAYLLNRANHTGTQSSDTITEGTNKFYTDARVKTYADTLYATLTGSYANPSWITSLAQSKITYTGTTAQYIRGDGSLATFPTAVSAFTNDAGYLTSSASGANPTASIGLTVVNGSASTFMRSDGAPALSQAIVPTWTGAHTFNAQITAQNIVPGTTNTYALGSASVVYTNAYARALVSDSALALTSGSSASITILSASVPYARVWGATGNLLVQTGGTYTELNYKIAAGSAGSAGYLKAGNLIVDASGNVQISALSKIIITEGSGGRIGQATLVAGTVAVSIAGLTTSSRAFLQLPGAPTGGSLTTSYYVACTSGTLTIQANVAAGTINVADTSVLNYVVFN